MPGLATASRTARELHRIYRESLVATWRAEVIGPALILSPGRCPLLVNHHAAYWIRWHNILRYTRRTPEIAATRLHWPANCHRPRPLRLQSWRLLRREVLTNFWSAVTRHSRLLTLPQHTMPLNHGDTGNVDWSGHCKPGPAGPVRWPPLFLL